MCMHSCRLKSSATSGNLDLQPAWLMLPCRTDFVHLVSHDNEIGDIISCDARCSAIGFGGKFFLRCPPSNACLRGATGHFYGKKWGCSRDTLRYHRENSATGVVRQVSRNRGGIPVRSRSSCRTELASFGGLSCGIAFSRVVWSPNLSYAFN